MSAVLQFDSVTKEYRSTWRRRTLRALNDFSLGVQPGEIFGFLGPNGAGKTTAIHLAMGFMRPTRGAGWLLGKPFGDAATRRRVGFLAENVALYHRPVRRLIRFYGALNGMRDPLLARRVGEVMDSLDLDGGAARNVGKFSRGMLQRAGLAQALVNDPELLVLDEPTSALDPAGRAAVRELLVRLRAAGKTVFLSSHLLSEIEAICDRVAILHHGRLIRVGGTSELLESRIQSELVVRGVDPEYLSGASQAEDGLHYRVRSEDVRAEIRRVWQLGGELVRVNPVRRSLEEIFLELTNPAEAPAVKCSPEME